MYTCTKAHQFTLFIYSHILRFIFFVHSFTPFVLGQHKLSQNTIKTQQNNKHDNKMRRNLEFKKEKNNPQMEE